MTQCERILRHMRDYGGITQAEAFTEYGISRLGARNLRPESRRCSHQVRNRHRKEPVRRTNILFQVFPRGGDC